MNIRRIVAAAVIALTASVTVVVAGQAPALAVDASGNPALAGPGGRGTGGYYIDYDNNTVAVNVAANSLELGKCLTLYLDSSRSTGVLEPGGSNVHLDPWIVRSCKSNTGRASGTQYVGSTYGVDLIRPLKTLAVCYGTDYTLGTCNVYAGSMEHLGDMEHEMAPGMTCGTGYKVTATGGVYIYDTHHPTRCDA